MTLRHPHGKSVRFHPTLAPPHQWPETSSMLAATPPRHVVLAALMGSWLFAGALTLAVDFRLCHLDDHGEQGLMALYCLNFIGLCLWIDFYRTEGWRRTLAIDTCLLFLLVALYFLLFPQM
jgi:hypothetical protein